MKTISKFLALSIAVLSCNTFAASSDEEDQGFTQEVAARPSTLAQITKEKWDGLLEDFRSAHKNPEAESFRFAHEQLINSWEQDLTTVLYHTKLRTYLAEHPNVDEDTKETALSDLFRHAEEEAKQKLTKFSASIHGHSSARSSTVSVLSASSANTDASDQSTYFGANTHQDVMEQMLRYLFAQRDAMPRRITDV